MQNLLKGTAVSHQVKFTEMLERLTWIWCYGCGGRNSWQWHAVSRTHCKAACVHVGKAHKRQVPSTKNPTRGWGWETILGCPDHPLLFCKATKKVLCQKKFLVHCWRKASILCAASGERTDLEQKEKLLLPLGSPRDMVRASFMAQWIKNLPAVQGTQIWYLGGEDSLQKEMATHSSILAWKISWTEEPGGLQSMGLQKVGHNWVTNTYLLRDMGSPFLIS